MDKAYLISNEESMREEASKYLDKIGNKWFKTSTTYNLISFLKAYLEMKDKFIDEIKRIKRTKEDLNK